MLVPVSKWTGGQPCKTSSLETSSKWGFPKHEFKINWIPIMFCVPLKDVRMSISNHSRQPCVMPGSYLNVALGASMFIHTLDLLLYIQSWFDFQLHRNWIMITIVLKNSDCNHNYNHNATIIISKHMYMYIYMIYLPSFPGNSPLPNPSLHPQKKIYLFGRTQGIDSITLKELCLHRLGRWVPGSQVDGPITPSCEDLNQPISICISKQPSSPL